jgi:hypothetical protein
VSGQVDKGGGKNKKGEKYVSNFNETFTGSRCPFWASNKQMESQDEALHFWG